MKKLYLALLAMLCCIVSATAKDYYLYGGDNTEYKGGLKLVTTDNNAYTTVIYNAPSYASFLIKSDDNTEIFGGSGNYGDNYGTSGKKMNKGSNTLAYFDNGSSKNISVTFYPTGGDGQGWMVASYSDPTSGPQLYLRGSMNGWGLSDKFESKGLVDGYWTYELTSISSIAADAEFKVGEGGNENWKAWGSNYKISADANTTDANCWTDNGTNMQVASAISNITKITFALQQKDTKFGILNISAEKWPELYLRGDKAGWNDCNDNNKFNKKVLDNGKCEYSLATEKFENLKGLFKIGSKETTKVDGIDYWNYAYGKDFDTEETFATTPDIVRVNVKKRCMNTGYTSGLRQNGIGWNLQLNNQDSKISAVTFTLDSDLKGGVLLVSAEDDSHVGDWYVVGEKLIGDNGEKWSHGDQYEMTLQAEKQKVNINGEDFEVNKIYVLDVDGFSGQFGFKKGNDANIYNTADESLQVSHIEVITTTGKNTTLHGLQNQAQTKPRDVRFFVYEIKDGENTDYFARVMLRTISLEGMLNGEKLVDPNDDDNLLKPRFDGTYRLTLPAVKRKTKYKVWYLVSQKSYGSTDMDDPYLINNEFKASDAFTVGKHPEFVLDDEFEGNVTFIWDETRPALKIMGNHKANEVELYGNFFGAEHWWNYDTDNPDKLKLKQLSKDNEKLFGATLTVTETAKEFDLYINNNVYGPNTKGTVNLKDNYNKASEFTRGSDNDNTYHCYNDMKWVFNEKGQYYVEVDLEKNTLTVTKGVENIALCGNWNNGTEVIDSWDKAALPLEIAGKDSEGRMQYAASVKFDENSANEGNRFLIILDDNKLKRYQHPTEGNFSLMPGDTAKVAAFPNTANVNPNCFYMAEGDYTIIVTVGEDATPVEVSVKGTVNYPMHWYLFGDIYVNGSRTNGQPHEKHCISLTDANYLDDLDIDLPGETISGYYVARKVRFSSHTKWHGNDNHSDAGGVFSITSKPLANDHEIDSEKGSHYSHIGSRLGVKGKYCNHNEVHGANPINTFNPENVDWDYEKNDFAGVEWTETSLMGVNAGCFLAPKFMSDAQAAKRFASNDQGYADGEYDIVFDLNKHRVAMANGAIETSVEALESLWGENIVNVYNLQGVEIRSNVMEKDAVENLPAGIYIVGKKKVLVTKK